MTEPELFALLEEALPGRVFAGLAKMGTPEAYISYSLVTGVVRNTLCGSAHCTLVMYRIDSYAITRAEAKKIMDRIFDLVDGCAGDPLLDERQDIYEQDTRIYRVSAVLSTTSEPDEVQS
jgi:hypothetical protein